MSCYTGISAGVYQSLAILKDGRVTGWGYNVNGQINIPIGIGNNATGIAAGHYHSLALLKDGRVTGWGNNESGQTNIPAGIGNNATGISAGGFHSLALLKDGTVTGWGLNSNGQTNIPVGIGANAAGIAVGYYQSLALLKDGRVTGWGANDYGQTNIPVGIGTNATGIAAGYYHSLALLKDGRVTGWGNNGNGEINIPVGIGNNATGIAAGGAHSLALLKDGSIVGWGRNGEGQINIPVGIGTSATGIVAGGYHSLALLKDGRVTGWGYNGYGQINIPTCPCFEKTNQAIIFNIENNINLLSVSVGLTASSTSNLPVSYTVSDSSIAEIRSNNILFLKAPGVITITANQNGNDCYFAAQPVSRIVTISSSICENLNFLDCQQGINKQIKTNVPEEVKELFIETNPPYCMSGSLDLSSFSNLEKVQCRFNKLNSIQGYGNKTKLIDFNISNNNFSNSLENIQSNELKTFNIRHNKFNGAIFDLSNKNQLEYFDCSNNNLTSYNGTSIPFKLKQFYAADNQLAASSVSNIILQFKNMVETYNLLGGTLYLDGPTNSPPNFDSFLASGFLRSKNWSVKCNSKGYGGNAGGGDILNIVVGAQNQTIRNLNIRNLFTQSITTPQQVYITIYGNVGSSATVSNNEPSIRVGNWPAGTKIILENAGPVTPNGCNPTNGVIAGRGGGTCGPNGAYSVTDAIWIDSQVELLIINNGIIGGGGAVGADNPNGCGEGGGGAGIPAGNVGLGGGQNTCCIGESPGTTLCGGSVSNFQNPKSNKGGDLGQDGGTIASSNPRPGYAIRKIAGASYSIAPWSSNPTFAGLGLVGDL